jgi:hypothetical protein
LGSLYTHISPCPKALFIFNEKCIKCKVKVPNILWNKWLLTYKLWAVFLIAQKQEKLPISIKENLQKMIKYGNLLLTEYNSKYMERVLILNVQDTCLYIPYKSKKAKPTPTESFKP